MGYACGHCNADLSSQLHKQARRHVAQCAKRERQLQKQREGLVKARVGDWPNFIKCERCGQSSAFAVYGVCNGCIYKLIQADKAKTPPPHTTEDERQ